jgi:hypothetical protein
VQCRGWMDGWMHGTSQPENTWLPPFAPLNQHHRPTNQPTITNPNPPHHHHHHHHHYPLSTGGERRPRVPALRHPGVAARLPRGGGPGGGAGARPGVRAVPCRAVPCRGVAWRVSFGHWALGVYFSSASTPSPFSPLSSHPHHMVPPLPLPPPHTTPTPSTPTSQHPQQPPPLPHTHRWSSFPQDHGTTRGSCTWADLIVEAPASETTRSLPRIAASAELYRNLHAVRRWQTHALRLESAEEGEEEKKGRRMIGREEQATPPASPGGRNGQGEQVEAAAAAAAEEEEEERQRERDRAAVVKALGQPGATLSLQLSARYPGWIHFCRHASVTVQFMRDE